MSTPRYEHQHCSHCKFHSRVGPDDVWFCDSGFLGGSLIARHSGDPADYGSTAVKVFLDCLKGNIQLTDGRVITWRNYIDHHAPAYYKVWEWIATRGFRPLPERKT